MDRLKIIPYYYTGEKKIEDVLKDKKALSMLWLEILLNDSFDWESYLNIDEVNRAYEKACIWYGSFSKLIEGSIKRIPLKTKKGKIDYREYRRFLEALNFVST
ncbi:MAG: hypothetical protein ACE5IH_00705 [Thermodesulfobacteriota bacterium]